MGSELGSGRSPSLRWRLLALVSVAALAILALAASLSYRQARHEVQELMDDQMAKTARLMLAQAQQGADHLEQLPAITASLRGLRARRSELSLEYRIARADGALLVRSPRAPTTPLAGALGFATVDLENQPWRSVKLETADGAYRIEALQAIAERDREALEIARKTVLPLALIFPLLLLAIYVSVRRGLKPLDDLAGELRVRSPENLAPLASRSAPREAQPLVAAINRLLFRLAGSLENERRFTADAAHELRTPLAAARIQLQVALLSRDGDQRQHALAQSMSGIDRATRLVEQLLRLARLDPLAELPQPAPVELGALADSALAEAREVFAHTPLAGDLAPGPWLIDGDADLIAIALRNLVDNACRYSPPGSPVTLFLRRHGASVHLGVRDRGPGVAAEQLPRLGERFYRGGQASGDGSGLGLTIVQRIAALHGARVELANGEGGGFVASLCWPIPADQPAAA